MMDVRFIAILTLTWVLPIGFMDLGFSIRPAISSELLDFAAQGFVKGKEHKRKLMVKFHRHLNFGEVIPGMGSGGKVVINPVSGAKELYEAYDLGGHYSRGELHIHGEPGNRFMVTLPNEIVITDGSGVTNTITDFKFHPGNVLTLDSQGKAKVFFGATLNLDRDRTGSKREGSIYVFVDYLP